MASLKQGKSTVKRRSPESSVRCGGHIVIVLNRMTIICVYLYMFILLLSARLKMQNYVLPGLLIEVTITSKMALGD